MLKLNGIEVWLEDFTSGQEYLPRKVKQIGSRNVTGTFLYKRRQRFTLRWRRASPSCDYESYDLLLVVYAMYGKGSNARQKLASVIHAPKEWNGSEFSQGYLDQEFFKGGLLFPYIPKHPKTNRVEGTLWVEIYRDSQGLVRAGDTSLKNLQRNRAILDKLGLFASFTFEFVHESTFEEGSGLVPDSDLDSNTSEIMESDFHLPTSPNEGTSVTSRLRPINLIRHPCPPYTEHLPKSSSEDLARRKRSSTQQNARRTRQSFDTARRAHGSRITHSPLRIGSSREATPVAGPSRTPIRLEDAQEMTNGIAARLEALSDLTRENSLEERVQNELIARLIKGKEKRLREERSINDALRKAVLLMEK
ncbi:hypothetical protein BDY19DRAFT_994906 [Irpex rosettiformis]|uniref:Uncharacterized protein n=1 Tax=Irpex rosettiformis TaxID=378272 RepID=A0ACB8U0R3_9APHY|nr:hypothetical protein BDY19DRAFT_994906 [Irpex rosettiformis]